MKQAAAENTETENQNAPGSSSGEGRRSSGALTEEKALRDYDFFKSQAFKAFRKKKYETSINCLETCCRLAQTICLLYRDDELEGLAQNLADEIVPRREFVPISGRVVFYDSHAKDNVVLTQQYVRALVASGREFLFLTCKSSSELQTQALYRELAGCPRASIATCDDASSSNVERLRYLAREVEGYAPEILLVQLSADDAPGILLPYAFPDTRRIFVETGDHTFYLGVSYVDCWIAFRNYGYSMAKQARGLKDEQIAMQPFYPILEYEPYQGDIPERKPGEVRLLSGGRITKIYGDDDRFLSIVERILVENPQVVFYYAGGGLLDGYGRFEHASRFMAERNLKERFVLLGYRRDLLGVMEQMDIYLNTYPVGGGLMVQLAAACKMPIVSYSSRGMNAWTQEFLQESEKLPQITFADDVDGLCAWVHELVENPELRGSVGGRMAAGIVKTGDFNRRFSEILKDGKTDVEPLEHETDVGTRMEFMIEAENETLHRYPGILIRNPVLLKRPVRYLSLALELLVKSDKKWFWGTLKKQAKKAVSKLAPR